MMDDGDWNGKQRLFGSKTIHEKRFAGRDLGLERAQDLKETSSKAHRGTKDDTLTDSGTRIDLAMNGGVKQMVGGLLKGGEHHHTVAHLFDTKACDSHHLSLERHDVGQEHHVARVDRHSIQIERQLDLLDDSGSRGLNAENLLVYFDQTTTMSERRKKRHENDR